MESIGKFLYLPQYIYLYLFLLIKEKLAIILIHITNAIEILKHFSFSLNTHLYVFSYLFKKYFFYLYYIESQYRNNIITVFKRFILLSVCNKISWANLYIYTDKHTVVRIRFAKRFEMNMRSL